MFERDRVSVEAACTGPEAQGTDYVTTPFFGFGLKDLLPGLYRPVPLASMSTVKDEAVEQSGPEKRELSPESSPPAKRVHLVGGVKPEWQISGVMREDEEMIGEEEVEEEKVVTEADVGISAYVNESLVAIKGGIIKHRRVCRCRER